MSTQYYNRQSGFNLVELMIAMVLGLLVLGAAVTVFQSNQRTFNANEGQNRIQEGARVAYELMSRDIRGAGGSACSYLARPDVEHTLSSEETKLLSNPVTKSSASDFTVTSGDDTAYQVDSATASSVVLSAGQVDKLSEAFKIGDKVVLCNANHLYVVTTKTVADSTRTLTFDETTPVVMTTDPNAPPTTVAVARYRSTQWHLVGDSLMVSRDGGADQAVINGVQALSVTYLQNGGNGYVAAPGDAVAMRVNLTLRGQKTVGGDVKVDGSNYITRTSSNVVTLRKAVR